jgi:predicted DNA-binding transcriptional regulator AlpA
MAPKLKQELLTRAGKLDLGANDDRSTSLIRFRDLKERRIVENWPTLLRWIKREGFPAGIRLGPNARAFPRHEVEAWLESRRIPSPARERDGS